MNSGGGVALLIAVKRLGKAKTRLAPTMSATARVSLVLAMLADTIASAIAASTVDSVTVVTADDMVAAAARRVGARVLKDPTPDRHRDPLNHAIRAAEMAARRQATNVGVLQGDLPALRSVDLTEAISAARAHRRSFVGDRHGTGTTALFAYGVPLDPTFGRDSARHHLSSGAVELGGPWESLRCDVDTAEDVAAALRLGVGPATWRVLHHPDATVPCSSALQRTAPGEPLDSWVQPARTHPQTSAPQLRPRATAVPSQEFRCTLTSDS